MAAPETYTITTVMEDGKAILEGFNAAFDVLPPKDKPKDSLGQLTVGQKLRGWANPNGQHGPYFRVAEERSQSASNGGGGAGKDDFARRPEHPENAARMRHSTVLGSTPAYLDQILTLSLAEAPKTWDDYWKLVGRVAGKLVKSYPTVEPEQPSPPEAEPTKSDEDIPF